MNKSLKALGFVLMLMYLIMTVLLPLANSWWFLLSIPLPFMLPHMDKIMNYLSDWMV